MCFGDFKRGSSRKVGLYQQLASLLREVSRVSVTEGVRHLVTLQKASFEAKLAGERTPSVAFGASIPGRCRSPLGLKTCHRHVFLTRRASRGSLVSERRHCLSPNFP